MNPGIFSEATITPSETIAGRSEEFVIRLVIGKDYPDKPTRIVFEFLVMLGASPTTRRNLEDDGYVEIYVGNPDITYSLKTWAPYRRMYEGKNTPKMREGLRMVQADLSAGLKEGDVLDLHWGDVFHGNSSGAKVTTVVPREDFHAWVKVRFFDRQDKGMPDHGRPLEGCPRPEPDEEITLRYRVHPREPHHLRLIRKPDKAVLIPYDVFWNVAEVEDIKDLVQSPTAPSRNSQGVFVYEDKNIHVRSRSLPMTETPQMERVYEKYNLYWGDMHVHSMYSSDAGAQASTDMTPGDLMEYGRERAALDFMAVTDHHYPNRDPLYLTITRHDWEQTLEDAAAHDRPGRFLVFPGFEFSDMLRGDTCVIFNFMPEYDEIMRPDFKDIRSVWESFSGRDFMTIPHFHNCGGKSDEWPHDSNVEPVLEIFSCHGNFEAPDTLEKRRCVRRDMTENRYARYFIQAGYKYGFTANSDGHKGHVGLNGLTAVFAENLEKKDILEAYRNRRVYGTTNARIRLIFTGNDQLMGSVVPNTSPKRLLIDAVGEKVFKKVDIFRNGSFYTRKHPDSKAFHEELLVEDETPSNWYVKVTQIDNHMAYSSPIWFEEE